MGCVFGKLLKARGNNSRTVSVRGGLTFGRCAFFQGAGNVEFRTNKGKNTKNAMQLEFAKRPMIPTLYYYRSHHEFTDVLQGVPLQSTPKNSKPMGIHLVKLFVST